MKSELRALYEHGLDASWQDVLLCFIHTVLALSRCSQDTVLHALMDMGIVRQGHGTHEEMQLHIRPFCFAALFLWILNAQHFAFADFSCASGFTILRTSQLK